MDSSAKVALNVAPIAEEVGHLQGNSASESRTGEGTEHLERGWRATHRASAQRPAEGRALELVFARRRERVSVTEETGE